MTTSDVSLEPMSEDEVRALPVSFPAFPTVARIVHMQRTAFYQAIREGEMPIPLVKVRRNYIARKCDVLNFLGMTEDDNGAGYQPTPSVERTTATTCNE